MLKLLKMVALFFHWQGNDKSKGHKDTVINYLLNGQKWQATITDYIFSIVWKEIRLMDTMIM